MFAILQGHEVMLVEGVLEWAKWFETADRQVALETLPSGRQVSTVFLGVDYGFGGEPGWFETMVFPGPRDSSALDVRRSATWTAAEAAHCAMVEKWRAFEPTLS